MSYRDPKQYIDTQSMQIQQNLQKTLANVGSQTVANINKIHEENAKKVEAIRANADARVEKAQNSIIQAQSKNPTADFGDLQPQLSKMNDLLLKDPTKRTAEEKTFITSMQSIGDTMGNMLKNTAMAQEAMLDQINKNPGTMGAIDPKADPELYAKLSVLANRTEGRTVARYKTNKNGQVVFSLDVYEKTKDGERFVGNVINDNVGTTQMPNVIPDVGQEMTDAITRTLNSNDFTSEFSEFLENGEKVYKNKKTGARISREDFKAKLRANAMPIIMGLTEREKASLYNNVLKTKGDDFAYSGGRLTELQKNTKDLILADAFMEDMMKRAELQSNVLGKTFDVTPPATELPEELTFSEKIKLSERKNKREAFNKAIGENLSKPSVLAVSSLDGNLMAVIREDKDSGERGWMLQRKNGTKWDDIADKLVKNISQLSVQLGYGEPENNSKNSSKNNKNEKFVFNASTGGFDKEYSPGEGVLKNK